MKYEERDQPLVYDSDQPVYNEFPWYECDCEEEKDKKQGIVPVKDMIEQKAKVDKQLEEIEKERKKKNKERDLEDWEK